MPAIQSNALSHNPNGADLQLVATYPRRVQASLARVWENVHDWEHLPHLHDSSFGYCELDEAGPWGWRVWSDPDHAGYIELVVDAECYVARTYAGGEQLSEIWTQLDQQGDCTDIRVEFYSAGVTDENRSEIGDIYLGLYAVLWDEDEAMMQQRHMRLLQKRDPTTEVNLGDIARLRENSPVRFELNRREYLLHEEAGGWVARPTICPHLLGPLQAAEQSGQMRCPWHGYVLELASGKCLSPTNGRCSLGLPPKISERKGELIVAAR